MVTGFLIGIYREMQDKFYLIQECVVMVYELVV